MKLSWFNKPDCAGCGHEYHIHRVGALLLCYEEECHCMEYVCPCTNAGACLNFPNGHDDEEVECGQTAS